MAAKQCVKRVVVQMAMLEEASPLLKSLGCEVSRPDRTGIVAGSLGSVYRGSREGSSMEVFVVCGGHCAKHGCASVGKVPAALVTHALIGELKPDVIINAGTCGGFKARGCAIGDVFVINGYKCHDARIPMPKLQDFGVGSWPACVAGGLADHLGAKVGVLTTGDSIDCPDYDAKTIAESGAHVKDMEGSAIAYVAQLHGVPVVGLKSVTDIVDGGRTTTEEFRENLHTAASALMEKLTNTLDFMDGLDTSTLVIE